VSADDLRPRRWRGFPADRSPRCRRRRPRSDYHPWRASRADRLRRARHRKRETRHRALRSVPIICYLLNLLSVSGKTSGYPRSATVFDLERSTCVLGGKYAGKKIRQAEIIASFQLLVSEGILFEYRDSDAN
jgi:hypothetical protein